MQALVAEMVADVVLRELVHHLMAFERKPLEPDKLLFLYRADDKRGLVVEQRIERSPPRLRPLKHRARLEFVRHGSREQ